MKLWARVWCLVSLTHSVVANTPYPTDNERKLIAKSAARLRSFYTSEIPIEIGKMKTPDQSCPWVGLTHWLGWIKIFQFLVGSVGWVQIFPLVHKSKGWIKRTYRKIMHTQDTQK